MIFEQPFRKGFISTNATSPFPPTLFFWHIDYVIVNKNTKRERDATRCRNTLPSPLNQDAGLIFSVSSFCKQIVLRLRSIMSDKQCSTIPERRLSSEEQIPYRCTDCTEKWTRLHENRRSWRCGSGVRCNSKWKIQYDIIETYK